MTCPTRMRVMPPSVIRMSFEYKISSVPNRLEDRVEDTIGASKEEKATMGIIVSYRRYNVQDTHGRECLRTFVDLELTHVFRLILNDTEYFAYAYITKQYIFTFSLLHK